MSLVSCPECQHQISSKAKACTSCGFPLNTLTERIAAGAKATSKVVTQPFANPVTSVSQERLFADIKKLSPEFSPGSTVNGMGTSIGGYVAIPGIPNVGIVRKYFCLFFVPVIPLGLYVVKDWTGSGGIFLGQISTENAAKYVNMKTQSIATVGSGLARLAVISLLIVGLVLFVRLFR